MDGLGPWTLECEWTVLDPGPWSANRRSWTLESQSTVLDPGVPIDAARHEDHHHAHQRPEVVQWYADIYTEEQELGTDPLYPVRWTEVLAT